VSAKSDEASKVVRCKLSMACFVSQNVTLGWHKYHVMPEGNSQNVYYDMKDSDYDPIDACA
jgi:hypothetical protein